MVLVGTHFPLLLLITSESNIKKTGSCLLHVDDTQIVILDATSETQGQSVGPGEKARRIQARAEVLENVLRAFFPCPADCPCVSEDGLDEA